MKVCHFILSAFFLLIGAAVLHAQNATVDSLERVLQRVQEDSNKVNTFIKLITALNASADYGKALNQAKHALKIAERIKFKRGQARLNNRIATLYQARGEYAEARKYYLAESKLWKDLGDPSKSAFSISRVANAYYTEGDISEAIKISYDVLKMYEAIGDKQGIGYAHFLMGHFYYVEKNYLQSLNNFLISKKLFEEIGNNIYIAYCKLGIARVDAKNGNYQEARKKYLEVLDVFEESDDDALAETHRGLGELYEDLGSKDSVESINNYLLGLKHYKKNLAYWENAKDKGSIATGLYHVGKINISLGNFKEAGIYLRKALILAKEIRSKGDLQDIYLSLSFLDSSQGNYKQAHDNFKNHVLYRDSVSNEETKRKLVKASMQFEFDKKEASIKAHQELKDAEQLRLKNKQYFYMGLLGLVILAVLLVVYIQWKNNKQKKKANALLHEEKQKVEGALQELKLTQSQLIHSEKMASLGELTAGIAHEIQNPLNFVNNFSEINTELLSELEEQTAKGNLTEIRAIAQIVAANEAKISQHGKRADAIVKSMLQHSRTSTGQKEAIDINSLIDEYLRLAYHGLRAKDKSFNSTVITDYDKTIGNVRVVPQDIGRVVLNLVTNAFYATTEKMKAEPHKYEPTVTVTTRKVSNNVEIGIADNGNGIPAKIADKIFQPFFTTKPTGQGTGLGLSLSYDIVKAHGGELKVNSEVNKGTKFSVLLPTT